MKTDRILTATAARALLGKFFSFGDDFVMENYMHFIALILRVRQSSCHASLIPPECKQRAEEILDYLVQKKGKEDMDGKFPLGTRAAIMQLESGQYLQPLFLSSCSHRGRRTP